MSDAEEQASCNNPSDAEEEEGPSARGRSSPPNPIAPFDQSVSSIVDDGTDNFSMEVHLGGDNSRHASEISSVSYQNLLEEVDTTGSMLSRRGSDDSTDSYPPDFSEIDLPTDDLETFEAADLPLSEHYNFQTKLLIKRDRDNKAEGAHKSDVELSASVFPKVGEKNEKDLFSDGLNTCCPSTESSVSRKTFQNLNVSDSISTDLSIMKKKNTSASCTQVNNMSNDEQGQKRRSSLEIRNNIPVTGEVKQYSRDSDVLVHSPGAKPKIKNLKQSPGMARRICAVSQDVSISEQECEMQDDSDHLQCTLSSAPTVTFSKSIQIEKMMETSDQMNKIDNITLFRRNLDIENEYDYVKYARVQHGNSYVGMRLAYSSSNDSINLKQNSMHGHGSDSVGSSCEPSPEKILHQKILRDLNGHVTQESVFEDSLTEIPLNASDSCLAEGKKAFTLSPEMTECDSVEVESVISDGENSTPGFPTVEDGLSSSQGSDVEEPGSMDHTSPSHCLRMKQKAEVDLELRNASSETELESTRGVSRDIDAQAIMNDLKAKREALDMAIADIKSAIQRSKQVALQSPFSQQTEQNEPVWIRRDNSQLELLDRQEEMRLVREEIERQQEEKQKPQADKGCT